MGLRTMSLIYDCTIVDDSLLSGSAGRIGLGVAEREGMMRTFLTTAVAVATLIVGSAAWIADAAPNTIERFANGRINCRWGHNVGLPICDTCRAKVEARSPRSEPERVVLWNRCLDAGGRL